MLAVLSVLAAAGDWAVSTLDFVLLFFDRQLTSECSVTSIITAVILAIRLTCNIVKQADFLLISAKYIISFIV
jgi:hypothetical protein